MRKTVIHGRRLKVHFWKTIKKALRQKRDSKYCCHLMDLRQCCSLSSLIYPSDYVANISGRCSTPNSMFLFHLAPAQIPDSFIPRQQNIQRYYSIHWTVKLACWERQWLPNCQTLGSKASFTQGMAVLPHHLWALMWTGQSLCHMQMPRNLACWTLTEYDEWFHTLIFVQTLHNDDETFGHLVNCDLRQDFTSSEKKYVDLPFYCWFHGITVHIENSCGPVT